MTLLLIPYQHLKQFRLSGTGQTLLIQLEIHQDMMILILITGYTGTPGIALAIGCNQELQALKLLLEFRLKQF